MLSIQELDEADSNWNNRLLGTKTGTLIQTKEYGESRRKLFGIKPKFITFSTPNGQIVAQLLALKTPKRGKKLFRSIPRLNPFQVLSWKFGPVIIDNSFKNEILESFTNFLKSKKKFSGSVHPLESELLFKESSNFKKENLGTFIIDLTPKLDTILHNTDKKSVRKNIERSQERGVKIKLVETDKYIEKYGELLNNHRNKNNLPKFDTNLLSKGIKDLKKVGQIGFLAFFQDTDEPIGGIFISTFNKYINEWGIARSELDQEKKLYSLDLLRWKIIEYGVEKKCKYYDLSGIKLLDKNQKEKGIYQNKKKWGGMELQYPLYYK